MGKIRFERKLYHGKCSQTDRCADLRRRCARHERRNSRGNAGCDLQRVRGEGNHAGIQRPDYRRDHSVSDTERQ
mgnify:CR=1 FL=1